MPAETFTRTTQDVADRVKDSFGDTSGSQITDEMLVRWINDGQQEIVNNNAIPCRINPSKQSDVIGISHCRSQVSGYCILISSIEA